MSGVEFVPFTLVPMVIGCLAAVACALPGNFLILRQQALIGDAISHVPLPFRRLTKGLQKRLACRCARLVWDW